jgi:hypothetical protein
MAPLSRFAQEPRSGGRTHLVAPLRHRPTREKWRAVGPNVTNRLMPPAEQDHEQPAASPQRSSETARSAQRLRHRISEKVRFLQMRRGQLRALTFCTVLGGAVLLSWLARDGLATLTLPEYEIAGLVVGIMGCAIWTARSVGRRLDVALRSIVRTQHDMQHEVTSSDGAGLALDALLTLQVRFDDARQEIARYWFLTKLEHDDLDLEKLSGEDQEHAIDRETMRALQGDAKRYGNAGRLLFGIAILAAGVLLVVSYHLTRIYVDDLRAAHNDDPELMLVLLLVRGTFFGSMSVGFLFGLFSVANAYVDQATRFRKRLYSAHMLNYAFEKFGKGISGVSVGDLVRLFSAWNANVDSAFTRVRFQKDSKNLVVGSKTAGVSVEGEPEPPNRSSRELRELQESVLAWRDTHIETEPSKHRDRSDEQPSPSSSSTPSPEVT